MSDPIRDLENLMHEGIDVNPLPASEVRRRGTRLRRRNNALAAAGALAVVLVVASPIAVLARGGDHADRVPVAPSPGQDRTSDTAWKQEIPAGFDLTALPQGQSFRFQARAYSVVDDLTLCGRPTFSTGSNDPVGPALDTRGATYAEAGTDGNLGRTLALYPSDKVAAKALDAVRYGVESCPTDQQANGAPLVYATVDTDVPADESFVFTEQAQMDKDLLSDLTLWQVARVGNALYLATDHTSAGGPQVVDSQVQHLATLSAPVLSDMCVFAAEPCDDSAVPPDPAVSSASIGEGAVSTIPADFPLDAGIVEPEGKLDGPSAKAQGVPDLDLCGMTAWPAQHTVQRLAVTSLVPQYRESRELVTFSRTEDAKAAIARITEAVQGCPTIPGQTSADDRAVDLQPADAAALGDPDEAVTFTVAYREGLGGGIWQLVRVGRAVYATYVEGEFSHDSIGQAVTGLSGKTKAMVPQLCPWTETGC